MRSSPLLSSDRSLLRTRRGTGRFPLRGVPGVTEVLPPPNPSLPGAWSGPRAGGGVMRSSPLLSSDRSLRVHKEGYGVVSSSWGSRRD